MVTRLIVFCLILTAPLFSAPFTATVNTSQIHTSESLTLNLTLSDHSSLKAPDTSGLEKLFIISSKQEQHSNSSINGKRSKATIWKYTLLPKRDGEFEIPAIRVDTTSGDFYTQPIKIVVSKSVTPKNGRKAESFVNIETSVDHPSPFKNQPVVLTIKVSSQEELANVQMQKLNIENAIVEVFGEPVSYQEMQGGVRVGSHEVKYLITPLKPGVLTLPKMRLQGLIADSSIGKPGSFYDDDFDPFFSFFGKGQFKPFNAETQEVVLEVKPPVASVDPWLVASDLQIEEVGEDLSDYQLGEPVKKEFKIKAVGLKASQLPSLLSQLENKGHYKLYEDPAKLEDKVVGGKLIAERIETYTLIPEKEGSLKFGKVAISYFDTEKNEKRTAYLAGKQRSVAASSNPKNDEVAVVEVKKEQVPESPKLETPKSDQFFLYVIIAALSALLLAVMAWVFVLQKRLKSHGKSKLGSRREKLTDLNPF